MKHILITGANSYVGTSFERYLSKWADQYQVDTLDMRGDSWKSTSFAGYDSIFHVAGIAHSDIGKASEAEKLLYYKVNTDLTVMTAEKAKKEGVSQFIFMSSAIVYGNSASVGQSKEITKDTLPAPANFYGDSKLKAEEGLMPLQSEQFQVVILRPPMLYGKGSKGNYPLLAKYAKRVPFFPRVSNQRSMLYIDNLCELVRILIDQQKNGIFCPQNERTVSTGELVQMIAFANRRKMYLIPGLTWLLSNLTWLKIVDKVFGNFVYAKELSDFEGINYRVVDFDSSIVRTEN